MADWLTSIQKSNNLSTSSSPNKTTAATPKSDWLSSRSGKGGSYVPNQLTSDIKPAVVTSTPKTSFVSDQLNKSLNLFINDVATKQYEANQSGNKIEADKLAQRLKKLVDAQKVETPTAVKVSTVSMENLRRKLTSLASGVGGVATSLLDSVQMIAERSEAKKPKVESKKIDKELPKPITSLLSKPTETTPITTVNKELSLLGKNKPTAKVPNSQIFASLSDPIKEWSKDTAPTNPTFIDQVAQGVGSMGGYLLLSAATGFGPTSLALVEAASEAGGVYSENKRQGKSVEEASVAADKNFLANLVINYATNKLGVFGEYGSKIKKAIASASTEGLQEAFQQLASNSQTDRPIMEGVLENAGVGAIVGGGITIVMPNGEKVLIDSKTEEVVGKPATEPEKRQVVKIDKPEGVKTASLSLKGPTASMTVQIEPEYRGKGLGRQVVQEIEAKAVENGATRMEISASSKEAGNDWSNSVGFWEKMGYTTVPGAVEKNGTIQMEKTLNKTETKPEVEAPTQDIKPVEVDKADQEVLANKVIDKADEPKIAEALRSSKGLSAEDIVNKYPDINLKRDVVVTDIKGKKSTIDKGEALTPYEMKGGKVLLQDGETYIVTKNQYQNVKNNSVSAEAKEFAPELKNTEETIKGHNPNTEADTRLKEMGYEVSEDMDGSLSVTKDGEDVDFDALPVEVQGLLEQNTTANPAKYAQYQLPGGENYREVLIKAPVGKENLLKSPITGKNMIKEGTPYFMSSHWDEPNVLAHIRLNERTYQDKPVTFIEEIQSDWARESRSGKTTANNELLKNWQEMSVKRSLLEAVKNKSEYMAWINGEQTSARYNLATYLENVTWEPTSQGEKKIILKTKEGKIITPIIDKNGEIVSSGNRTDMWTGKKLDEVLGKGLADKIMADETGELSGEGLKFGGEWAVNLYDKQFKSIVENLTGGKVEVIDMGLPVTKTTLKWRTDINANNMPTADLTVDNMEVGKEIYDETMGHLIITKVLGNGKFKAADKYFYQSMRARWLDMEGDKNWMQRLDNAKTFDISTKASDGQQAIKLTPEIIAKIKSEAPILKAPSGKDPFAKPSSLPSEKVAVPAAKPLPKEVNKEAQEPVGQGEKNKSRAYTRVIDRLSEETQLDVSYNRLNLEKDAERAMEFVVEDPKAATRVAFGLEAPPAGQTETAISIALADKAYRDGNIELASQLEASRSLRQTRRGQEIVSERGRFDDNSPYTMIRRVMDARLKVLGTTMRGAIDEALSRASSIKENAIKKVDEKVSVIKKKLAQDQGKIKLAQDIIDSLRC